MAVDICIEDLFDDDIVRDIDLWDYIDHEEERDFWTEQREYEAKKDFFHLTPSQFVETAILMPNAHTRRLEPFSFAERGYLQTVYDIQQPRILLKTGRQVEKSTSLANKLLAFSCIIPHFKSLYVSPSATQTKDFSKLRLKELIETCPDLRAWFSSALTDNVFAKKAENRSVITLRYAFLNADRCRGLSADLIAIDEFQDILLDNIPVIEEAASHSPFKWFLYSGTPKSMDNPIEYYWENFSTKNEWAVPCEHHGGRDPGTWHWNILGEANIGAKSLVCDKCSKQIYADHPSARWVQTGNPSEDVDIYAGFRIPQLMVPWLEWKDILTKYNTYGRPEFFNEVLGISFDSGERPLTQQDVIDNCDNSLTMDAEHLADFVQKNSHLQLYAGIDWGADSNKSYTVITVGAYVNSRFTVLYVQRFTGPEQEPRVQLDAIKKLIKGLRIHRVGCDYGGGLYQNDELQRDFGSRRVFRYQYAAPKNVLQYNDELARYLVHRTEIMSSIFNAIKRRDTFRFPNWGEFQSPFANDYLNIFSEYNERRRMTEYKKSPSTTDDAFHSLVYCFMASTVDHPRPDVFVPSAKADGVFMDF